MHGPCRQVAVELSRSLAQCLRVSQVVQGCSLISPSPPPRPKVGQSLLPPIIDDLLIYASFHLPSSLIDEIFSYILLLRLASALAKPQEEIENVRERGREKLLVHRRSHFERLWHHLEKKKLAKILAHNTFTEKIA
jgi:hypothetical protein